MQIMQTRPSLRRKQLTERLLQQIIEENRSGFVSVFRQTRTCIYKCSAKLVTGRTKQLKDK